VYSRSREQRRQCQLLQPGRVQPPMQLTPLASGQGHSVTPGPGAGAAGSCKQAHMPRPFSHGAPVSRLRDARCSPTHRSRHMVPMLACVQTYCLPRQCRRGECASPEASPAARTGAERRSCASRDRGRTREEGWKGAVVRAHDWPGHPHVTPPTDTKATTRTCPVQPLAERHLRP
jgi:hypothetical protein